MNDRNDCFQLVASLRQESGNGPSGYLQKLGDLFVGQSLKASEAEDFGLAGSELSDEITQSIVDFPLRKLIAHIHLARVNRLELQRSHVALRTKQVQRATNCHSLEQTRPRMLCPLVPLLKCLDEYVLSHIFSVRKTTKNPQRSVDYRARIGNNDLFPVRIGHKLSLCVVETTFLTLISQQT